MVRGKLDGWETGSFRGPTETARSPPLRKEELEDKESPLKDPMRLKAAVIEAEAAIWLLWTAAKCGREIVEARKKQQDKHRALIQPEGLGGCGEGG